MTRTMRDLPSRSAGIAIGDGSGRGGAVVSAAGDSAGGDPAVTS
jgi:hypothetical protein